MKRLKSARVYVVVLALSIAWLTLSSCGKTTTERLQEAAEQPTVTAATTESTPVPTSEGEPTSTPKPAPTDTPIPVPIDTPIPIPTDTPAPVPTDTPTLVPTDTPTPAPTATPTPKPEAIQLVAQGFGQDGRDLGFAFLVENPNVGFAIERSQYQIAAYDNDGTVLETDSGYIELIVPSQTLGVAGTMWLDEGMTVSKVEVQLRQGDTVATDPIPSFETESSIYYAGEYSDNATAIVSSPYNRDLTNIRVSAVVYNEGGEIVGGGFTYLNFILANSSTGVDVGITSSGNVANVELYPSVSGLTSLRTEDALPEGASDLVLVKQGFGQDERGAGFGMLIENPNDGFAVESSQYHLTAFAEDGHVLETEEGYVKVLLPNQTLGVGGDLYLEEGMRIARVDIQIKAGSFEESDPIPYFTAQNVDYQVGTYSSKVTGEVISPYTKDLTNIRVSAVVYNEGGEIVGGGFTYLNFILANSSTGVDVGITSSGNVANVELYPSVSGLTSLRTEDALPEGASDLVLVKQGFGQDERGAGFGMLIENPNDGFAVESSQYHLTAFAEDGHVLETEEGYVKVLLPNQTLGVGGDLYLEEGMRIARVDIQVKAGSFEESDPIPYFTAQNIAYQAGTYSSKVTGEIVSPYTKDITSIRVSAIGYNEAEEIIGGGSTYLDFVSANGKAAVEVSIISSETPASTELYAAVSGLSGFD